jgi:hypothetical protein
MHQYQVIVETGETRLFVTDWVTGRESAVPLVMAIASRFEESLYRVTVASRIVAITAQPWGDFVVGGSGN